jgi:hypothetical protein
VAGRLRHGPPCGGRLADGCVRPASRPGGSQRCTRGGTLTTRTAFRRTIGGRLRHACITAGRISTLHTWRGAYDTDRLLADDWRTVASRLHHGRAYLNAAHVAGRLRHGPPFGGRLADGCVTPASRPGGSQRCTPRSYRGLTAVSPRSCSASPRKTARFPHSWGRDSASAAKTTVRPR